MELFLLILKAFIYFFAGAAVLIGLIALGSLWHAQETGMLPNDDSEDNPFRH